MKQVVFVLGVLGVAAYAILRPLMPALCDQDDAHDRITEGQLRSELDDLRRAIDETSRIARSAQGGVATIKLQQVARAQSPQSNDTTPEEQIADGSPLPEEKPLTRDEQVANLEADFAAEPYEQAWARSAKERVTRLLDSNAGFASVQSIDCRASMCRVETSHESLDLYRQYMFAGFSGEHQWLGARTTTLVHGEPGAPITAVTFLMRSSSDGT